jgi:hypothetical protein
VVQSKSIKQFYLKKQTEKTNRGNSHEIPILDVGACLFLLWKKETDVVLMGNSSKIVALWINGKGEPAKPAMMVRCLQKRSKISIHVCKCINWI